MISLDVFNNGRVKCVYSDASRGAYTAEAIPDQPTPPTYPSGAPMERYELYYVDGVLEWRAFQLEDPPPPPPEPEPEQKPEPIGTSELRRAAFKSESDELLITALSYQAEGKTDKYEEMLSAHLAAKASIRERYPDNTEEVVASVSEEDAEVKGATTEEVPDVWYAD